MKTRTPCVILQAGSRFPSLGGRNRGTVGAVNRARRISFPPENYGFSGACDGRESREGNFQVAYICARAAKRISLSIKKRSACLRASRKGFFASLRSLPSLFIKLINTINGEKRNSGDDSLRIGDGNQKMGTEGDCSTSRGAFR